MDYPIRCLIISNKCQRVHQWLTGLCETFEVCLPRCQERKALKLSAAHYPALVRHRCKRRRRKKKGQKQYDDFQIPKKKRKQASVAHWDSCSFLDAFKWTCVCSLRKTAPSGQDDLSTAVLICCTNSWLKGQSNTNTAANATPWLEMVAVHISIWQIKHIIHSCIYLAIHSSSFGNLVD